MNRRCQLIALAVLAVGWAAASAQEPTTLRFGHVVQAGAPISLGVQRFGEIEASYDPVVVKVYREEIAKDRATVR